MNKQYASSKYCYIQPTGYHEKLYNFEKACRREKLKRHSTCFDMRQDNDKRMQSKVPKNKNNAHKNQTRDYSKEYISRTDEKYLPSNFTQIFNDNFYPIDSTHDDSIRSQKVRMRRGANAKDRLAGGGSIFDNLVSLFNVQSEISRFANTGTSPCCRESESEHDDTSCSCSEESISECSNQSTKQKHTKKKNKNVSKQPCKADQMRAEQMPKCNQTPKPICAADLHKEDRPPCTTKKKPEPKPCKTDIKKERKRSKPSCKCDVSDDDTKKEQDFLYQFNNTRPPTQVPIVVLARYNNDVRQVDSDCSMEPTHCFTQKSKRPVRESSQTTPNSLGLGHDDEKEMCRRLARLDFALAKIGKELDMVHATYSHLQRFRELEHKFHDLHKTLNELKTDYCSGHRVPEYISDRDARGNENKCCAEKKKVKEASSSCDDSDEGGRKKFCCSLCKKSPKPKKSPESCCESDCDSSDKKSRKSQPKAKKKMGKPVKACKCGGKNGKRPDVCCQCQRHEYDVKGDDPNSCNCPAFPDINHCSPCKGKVITQHLCKEIYKAVENKSICDLALTIVECQDDIFQINIVTLEEPKRIACVRATPEAVEEAKEIGIFDYFLTFFLTDARLKGAQRECECGKRNKK